MGPCADGMECCHNDGNPLNNAVENLRWDTRLSNAADRLKHGNCPMGEEHSCAKLIEAQVREIRDHPRGYGFRRKLARKFGVHIGTIQRIRAGTSWANVA